VDDKLAWTNHVINRRVMPNQSRNGTTQFLSLRCNTDVAIHHPVNRANTARWASHRCRRRNRDTRDGAGSRGEVIAAADGLDMVVGGCGGDAVGSVAVMALFLDEGRRVPWQGNNSVLM